MLLLIGFTGSPAAELREVLEREGWPLRAEAGVGAGLSALTSGPYEATLLSTDVEGVDLPLVERLAAEERTGAIVLAGSSPSLELTLGGAKAGVREVLRLPLRGEDLERLLRALRRARGTVQVPREPADTALVGRSAELLEVFQVVGRVATSSATVLITGESGTGKELVARALHEASARSARPFVAVNCAAIPEDLLESELFGHERGAFTGAVARKLGRFERAAGGTLFLDEIGDMSLVLQAKILRVLQEREIERLGGEERIRVDVRVVAATHRELEALVESGGFREDLFYRLAVVRLRLPPLRERAGDIRELTLHFASRFAREYGRPVRYLTSEAIARLEAHSWPGNIRELRNVLERAVLVATGDTLDAADLVLEPARAGAPAGALLPGYRADATLAEVEALHITRVLRDVDGHVGRAAAILGVHRNTVTRKASEYGISVR